MNTIYSQPHRSPATVQRDIVDAGAPTKVQAAPLMTDKGT